MRTAKSLDASMYLDVLIEVCSLSEAKATIFKRANIGSFIGVNPQMIEKIVPLSEMFSTIFMITFEYLDISLRLRIFKGEDPEFLSCWDMLFDLNRSQIEGFATLDKNWHIIC